jgi:tetratricopeptide (TPR) repeat protein
LKYPGGRHLRRTAILSIIVLLIVLLLPSFAEQIDDSDRLSYYADYNNPDGHIPPILEPVYSPPIYSDEHIPSILKPYHRSGSKGDTVGSYEESYEDSEEYPAIGLGREVSNISPKGDDLLLQGKYKEALDGFNKSLELNSSSAGVWYDKGLALGMLGRHAEAAMAFDEAINISPSKEAWNAKGEALRYQGNYKSALNAYNKSLEINSSFAGAWYNKGLVWMKLGNYPEAAKAFDQAVTINPSFDEAMNSKSLALDIIGNQTRGLSKANEINSSYEAQNGKNETIISQKNSSQAIRELDGTQKLRSIS